MTLSAPPAIAQSQMAESDNLKAAFIYSFVRYSEWPQKADNIKIAFFGPHRLYTRLSRIVATRPESSSPHYQLCSGEKCLSEAHAIYIGRDDPLAHQLGRITRLNALTISDIPGFLEAGGIVEIHRQGDHFVFRISLKNAVKQGIYISPEMLDYAEEVLR